MRSSPWHELRLTKLMKSYIRRSIWSNCRRLTSRSRVTVPRTAGAVATGNRLESSRPCRRERVSAPPRIVHLQGRRLPRPWHVQPLRQLAASAIRKWLAPWGFAGCGTRAAAPDDACWPTLKAPLLPSRKPSRPRPASQSLPAVARACPAADFPLGALSPRERCSRPTFRREHHAPVSYR